MPLLFESEKFKNCSRWKLILETSLNDTNSKYKIVTVSSLSHLRSLEIIIEIINIDYKTKRLIKS